MDRETDEFIEFLKAYQHIHALEVLTRMASMKDKEPESPKMPDLDEKIAKNMKFVKTKPPRCKRCFYYTYYGINDPKRYVLIVETKISPLPFLFLKPTSRYVIPEECFYDDYKKLFIIACPTVECAGAWDLEMFNVHEFATTEK